MTVHVFITCISPLSPGGAGRGGTLAAFRHDSVEQRNSTSTTYMVSMGFCERRSHSLLIASLLLYRQWYSPLQCQIPYWLWIVYTICICGATTNNQLTINLKDRKMASLGSPPMPIIVKVLHVNAIWLASFNDKP